MTYMHVTVQQDERQLTNDFLRQVPTSRQISRRDMIAGLCYWSAAVVAGNAQLAYQNCLYPRYANDRR